MTCKRGKSDVREENVPQGDDELGPAYPPSGNNPDPLQMRELLHIPKKRFELEVTGSLNKKYFGPEVLTGAVAVVKKS
jgi:hypothetical protein